jgi:uroporphyrinogen-III decarboxylase
VIFLSDNFDSNVQNPNLFRKYSRDFYSEVARRVHDKGKYFTVHVDGEMHGCLKDMADCGVDCIDAVTPAPMFSLTPQQVRNEAGNNIILSGGIPATIFGPTSTDREFKETVISWLDTRMKSSRLIMAAGDQVPTDAPRRRIEMLPELIEQYGRY